MLCIGKSRSSNRSPVALNCGYSDVSVADGQGKSLIEINLLSGSTIDPPENAYRTMHSPPPI
jgi:hypothetical protein